MHPLIAIVGPTGVGKSHLALYLAQKFNGEIINADSLQVFRHMDIGTAKPSAAEMSSVPHHLFDIIKPDEDFSLAQYQSLAFKSIYEVQKKNRLPFLVGGSGQYVWAVLEGWVIPKVPPDLEYRKSLEIAASSNGAEELYLKLQQLDPTAAGKIDKRNVRRVIRALEVISKSNTPISQLQRKESPDFNFLIIGLTADRKFLYQKIDSRVEKMFQQGFLEEVKKLLSLGYDFTLPSMNSIGYKQIGMMLQKQINLDQTVAKIKVDTHRFVRHQYAWFKLDDRRIIWFNIESQIDTEVDQKLDHFLQEI